MAGARSSRVHRSTRDVACPAASQAAHHVHADLPRVLGDPETARTRVRRSVDRSDSTGGVVAKTDVSALVAHLQAEYVGLHETQRTYNEDGSWGPELVFDTHPVRSAQIREQLAALGADVPDVGEIHQIGEEA